jgi:hypothetical protein
MSKSYYDESQRMQLITELSNKYGRIISKEKILEYTRGLNLPNPHFLISNRDIKVGRDYNLSLLLGDSPVSDSPELVSPAMIAPVVQLRQKKLITEVDNLIPEKSKEYVPFGFFKQLEKIVKAKMFYPVFITGLSGNGKTTMVEQVCAKLNRECIRVNISIETDEDDLIGGSTLIDGNITYREGPVITAMRRGAVLLIDEIDRGSNKLMCLQSILEGKPFFNKKTGDVVHPAEGFTVIATANTKGKGTEDGRFIAAQILDEAFLERFPITVEQEYPSPTTERKIIMNKMETLGVLDEDFAEKLITWAEIIRKTFEEGGVDEIISTRRLLHIVQAFSIFGSQEDAIEYCINRFDADTKTAFLDLYKKMGQPAEEVSIPVESAQEPDTYPTY